MKAIEARKLVKQANQDKVTQAHKNLEKIYEKIKKAAYEGKEEIGLDASLSSKEKELLEQEGYTIKVINKYNESYYSVSWKVATPPSYYDQREYNYSPIADYYNGRFTN